MLFLTKYLSILILLIFAISCAKNENQTRSKVILQMPSEVQQKAGGLQSFSANSCFAVNITASDIDKTPSTACDSGYGAFGGLVPAGGSIELEVDRGQQRAIEIYYVNSDQGCQPFDSNSGLVQTFGSNNVHRLGTTEGVNFDQAEVAVEVNIQLPSPANRMDSIASLPSACEKDPSPIDLMLVKQARVVLGAARGTMTGGSRIHLRILKQKLDMQPPIGFSGRIVPNRLGDKQ